MPLFDRAEVIAHRGASAHAPENTLASFALALSLGADRLELDVRASADGVFFVLHDPTLERTAGLPHAIAELTSAEVAALPAECRPPTLDAVLDAFGDTTSYLIEVKRIPVREEADLLDAIAFRGLDDRVTIQSFDHLLLRRLRHRDPAQALAALFDPGADVLAGMSLVAPFVDGIGPHADQVDVALVGLARARGLAVRAWTVNDSAEMDRLLAAGVDGIITDRPERARAAIGRARRVAAPAAGAVAAGPQAARMAATSPA